jgi:hypothetical protein
VTAGEHGNEQDGGDDRQQAAARCRFHVVYSDNDDG